MKRKRYPRKKTSWLGAVCGLGLAVSGPAPSYAAAPAATVLAQGLEAVPCALTVKQQPLAEVFASIEQQTGYHFLYVDQADVLGRKISVEAPHSNSSPSKRTCSLRRSRSALW